MSHPDSAFFVFDTHAAAEEAIRTMGHSGFDMKKLSLAGKGDHSEEKADGLLHHRRPHQGRGRHRRVLGRHLGPAAGVPNEQAIKFEAALKVDNYMLVVHGSAEDQERARSVLARAKVAIAS
jgi:hypothetical protein